MHQRLCIKRIGYKNKIPWLLKNDLKYFKKLTIGNNNNAVVMGRKTWESLPVNKLPKRDNLILGIEYDSLSMNYTNNDWYAGLIPPFTEMRIYMFEGNYTKIIQNILTKLLNIRVIVETLGYKSLLGYKYCVLYLELII